MCSSSTVPVSFEFFLSWMGVFMQLSFLLSCVGEVLQVVL
jgi:hypothetical protein